MTFNGKRDVCDIPMTSIKLLFKDILWLPQIIFVLNKNHNYQRKYNHYVLLLYKNFLVLLLSPLLFKCVHKTLETNKVINTKSEIELRYKELIGGKINGVVKHHYTEFCPFPQLLCLYAPNQLHLIYIENNSDIFILL